MTHRSNLRFWSIEEAGGLVRIDRHNLPDLDDLMLEVLSIPEIAERNAERWHDAFDDGREYAQDRATSIPDTDNWSGGESVVGFYRTNPCSCGDDHTFDMGEVPMDDDGNPTGRAARGAFLGVYFR